MKTIQIKHIIALIIGGILFSCSDDFLETEPSGVIDSKQVDEVGAVDPNIARGMILGIYSKTFAFGTGGTEKHEDFGQKSVDICMDLMCGDMAMGGESYGWFAAVSYLNDMAWTNDRAYMMWRYYYQIVKGANAVFDNFGSDTEMPEDDTQRAYFGQAKALRAYAYFYLVNLYQNPYDESKNNKALPIYRSQLTNEPAPKSTVQDIYNLIIQDLKDAIVALKDYEPVTKTEINEYIASGLLANAYLFTGQYAEAAQLAENVINSGLYPMMDMDAIIESGFNSVEIPSWMWAINLTTDNSPALPTFWGHVDYFTYSYAAAGDMKLIDANLYASIPATDQRKKQFLSTAPQIPLWKFYDKNRVAMGNRLWDNDEVYMRVEEMYLIDAEALARSGDEAGAREALKALVEERDPAALTKIDGLSGSALLDEIYYNWRVEMWGEGRSLLAMKRFKKSVTRGDNHIALAGETYSYNYEKLIYQIPQREVLNNSLLGE